MTQQFENFVNAALDKSLASDVTLPTANKIPVFTGIGRQVTGKTKAELGLALSTDLGTAASADTGDFDPAGSAATALSTANTYTDSAVTKVWKDQGNYDVSGGTAWPTSANTIGAVAIKAGNLWVVTGAAIDGTTLTGGKVVSNGDTIRALVNNATNAGADWGVNEANLGYTPENQANKVTNLSVPSDTTFPSTNAVIAGLGAKQTADATLTALAAFNSNGSLHQTSADTFVARTLTAGTGISIDNGDGVAGDPTVTCTLDVSAKLTTADVIADQLISGLLPASGVLANTISAGVAYVQGARVSVPLTNKTWTANRDTYVDLSSSGVYTYVEVANGAGVPAVTALHMRVAKVVSGAVILNAITMLKAPVTSYGTGSGANIYGANNTLLGKALAPIATTAYGNTIVGDTQCDALSTGYENVVIGAATPALNTGYQNVVIGKGSGAALTTSQYNVLIGYEAGAANSTILDGIVAIGYSAAMRSTGAQITAIGQSAGGANTTGLRWTAIGDSSGSGSTATASDWTAVGSGAITGAQGVSIGSYAGSDSFGAGNISIGYNAGRYSLSTSEAISIGLAANYQSVRGTGSICIGTRAGSGTVANHKSTSDSNAIHIGWEATRSSAVPTATGLSNIISIGKSAEVASSNSCVIGSTGAPLRVGFNMTTPTARLHLPAGESAAKSAPLKFTSGALQTTAEAGAVEYDGTKFYATPSDATRRRLNISNEAVLPSNISVTASPFTYQNTTAYDGDVIISGGTVGNIEFTRDNITFYTVGFIEGVLRLSPNDRVRVTYTVAPTMTLVPR